MEFTPSTVEDVQQIQEWIKSDPDHVDRISADFWLTGNDCVFAGCLRDNIGSIVYFRVDKEGELARLHVQFAPSGQVAKGRLVKALLNGYYKIESKLRNENFKGVIYESTNPSLIQFMSRLGYLHEEGDDYLLLFEEKV